MLFLTNLLRICSGGELFFHITKKKYLTEAKAALIMKQAFYALCYLHSNMICHRDIKPENFLLYQEDDDSHIKLIDFGLAKKVTKDELMTTPNGTPYYIAPEVLKGSYTALCDNWSMGVVMYIMLSGKPPFTGKDNNEILHNVLHTQFDFKTPVWEQISEQAKDLISKLLCRNADERLTAEEAFNHPWIQQQKDLEEHSLKISSEVFDNMMDYMESINMKKTSLHFLASRIPEDQITALREAFSYFDKNGDGKLTGKELKEGIAKVKDCQLTEKDIDQAMDIMDSNKNGFIDYTEFIAACMQSQAYLEENHLKQAFSYFDKDDSGKISKDELKECLQDEEMQLNEEVLNRMISEVDMNKDGQIDYNEYITMMQTKGKFK